MSTNREELLAHELCRVLERGARELDPSVAERLRAARERALRHQRVSQEAHDIVGAGGMARLRRGDGRDGHVVRTLLAMLALLLGVVFAYYWNGFDQAGEDEEIDSALLADDLPPNAYLDKGFQAWISHYAQSAR